MINAYLTFSLTKFKRCDQNIISLKICFIFKNESCVQQNYNFEKISRFTRRKNIVLLNNVHVYIEHQILFVITWPNTYCNICIYPSLRYTHSQTSLCVSDRVTCASERYDGKHLIYCTKSLNILDRAFCIKTALDQSFILHKAI